MSAKAYISAKIPGNPVRKNNKPRTKRQISHSTDVTREENDDASKTYDHEFPDTISQSRTGQNPRGTHTDKPVLTGGPRKQLCHPSAMITVRQIGYYFVTNEIDNCPRPGSLILSQNWKNKLKI
ncbi:hypothetical protein ABEB36_007385 [Hypothenemus hampei]|uniref:Uncharacterized protein n=1 Tax=Hypothenemus hampei TaxID=57062 RepID=A0ABD1ETW1_HYPHA